MGWMSGGAECRSVRANATFVQRIECLLSTCGLKPSPSMTRVLLAIAFVLVLAVAVVAVVVEREGPSTVETVSSSGTLKALILYHPSRDARFSDDLSLALARGLVTAGFAVDRATVTAETPARPAGYALIGIVSNTYFWTPDLPTTRYLRRARLQGIPVVGVVGGAGATGRSERVLRQSLAATGATVLSTQSFWLLRPNDESRSKEPNRQVAIDGAKQLGIATGTRILRESNAAPVP